MSYSMEVEAFEKIIKNVTHRAHTQGFADALGITFKNAEIICDLRAHKLYDIIIENILLNELEYDQNFDCKAYLKGRNIIL